MPAVASKLELWADQHARAVRGGLLRRNPDLRQVEGRVGQDRPERSDGDLRVLHPAVFGERVPYAGRHDREKGMGQATAWALILGPDVLPVFDYATVLGFEVYARKYSRDLVRTKFSMYLHAEFNYSITVPR